MKKFILIIVAVLMWIASSVQGQWVIPNSLPISAPGVSTIETRESFSMMYGTLAVEKIARSEVWEKIKPTLVRMALHTISQQDNKSRRLEHPMQEIRLLGKSA